MISTPLWPTGRTINDERRRSMMPLTRDFKETIRARVARDPKFRKELLREGIESMLTGDISTAKTILRDYINATVGFTELAEATHIPSKSLMRMLGPSGNPRADNLFVVVSFLQHREGVRFQVKTASR
jgi:DNA-binding phage protein